MIPPFYPRGHVEHPPPRDDRPYGDRTAAELAGEAEWVRREYLGEPELVPGGGVSELPGAPGTHHADGAGVGERKPAPSVQAPPSLPVARGKTTDTTLAVGRGGGLTVAWAATGTALVITTVYALARVTQWHLLIGKEWLP